MNLKIFIPIFILFSSFTFAEELDVAALNRSDNIPVESLAGSDDQYFEGYLQALVDMHFYEYKVVVLVKDRNV